MWVLLSVFCCDNHRLPKDIYAIKTYKAYYREIVFELKCIISGHNALVNKYCYEIDLIQYMLDDNTRFQD